MRPIFVISFIRCFFDGPIGRFYRYATNFSDRYFFPALLLFMRYWMANIFWYSGINKVSSWQNTLYLFEFEYRVPFISAQLAAISATAIELAAPLCLLVGFITRIVTIPLLSMVVVIEYTYISLPEHVYWGLLLSTILFFGPGKFSADYLFRKIGTAHMIDLKEKTSEYKRHQ